MKSPGKPSNKNREPNEDFGPFGAMKRVIAIGILAVIAQACTATVEPSPETQAQTPDTISMTAEEQVSAWIDENAVPISNLDDVSDGAAFEALRDTLQDVRIIGIGEPSHGSREFYKMRMKLLSFLVNELGYDTLILEAGYGASDAVNRYITEGEGDPKEALLELGYNMYATEEFLGVLDWVKAHNANVDTARQVRFYGVDTWPNDLSRLAVLSYLESHAPDIAPAAADVLSVIDEEEGKYPAQMLPTYQLTFDSPLPEIDALIASIAARQEALVAASSIEEYREIIQYLNVMRQWVQIHVPTAEPTMLPPELNPRHVESSRIMIENVKYLIDTAGERNGKIIAWAHNYHIGDGYELQGHPQAQNFGYALRETYGDEYYAIAMEFNQGGYLARVYQMVQRMLEENSEAPDASDIADMNDQPSNDQYKTDRFTPASEGSVSWHLAQTGHPALLLQLDGEGAPDAISEWLKAPMDMHFVPWAYVPPQLPVHFKPVILGKHFDAVIFIDQVEPNTPLFETPSGL